MNYAQEDSAVATLTPRFNLYRKQTLSMLVIVMFLTPTRRCLIRMRKFSLNQLHIAINFHIKTTASSDEIYIF